METLRRSAVSGGRRAPHWIDTVTATILPNATLPDGRRANVHIEDGRISAIGAAQHAGLQTIDLGGALLVPSFVDGHVHLDKTLLGLPFQPHRSGDTIAERIARERELRRELRSPVGERAKRLIDQIVPLGTTALRSHVDIDPEVGLSGLHALLRLRETTRAVDIQLVAFPQSGIMISPDVADLLDAAIGEGADFVGGLDPAGFVNKGGGTTGGVFG